MVIQEYLPNPVGKDAEGEYIKLYNDGDQAVFLNGWRVEDARGKSFNLQGQLAPGGELVLPYQQTKITLNNKNESLFLYNASGELASELSHSGTAKEGAVIIKNNPALIETLPELSGSLYNGVQSSASQLFIFIALTATIFASLAVYAVKHLNFYAEENYDTK